MVSGKDLHEACCGLMTEVVRGTGSAKVRVTGLSMLPSILPGDVLSVRRRTENEFTPGQIVVFGRDGRLTAHRIIQISGEYLITRGDCVPGCDLPVRLGDVVGRVEEITRDGRPVDPRYTIWRRIAASMMRRSERCIRLYLRLAAGARRLAAAGPTLTD